jgi:RNA polymerase sigma-70 factor (ECF subfamily)
MMSLVTRLVEDRALLDAFRRGDRAALAEVYREYVRPLYALVATGFSFESGGGRRWFAGYHDPWVQENTVQEVFARAFTPAARNAYDGLRPYRNYLFTIGRNLIMDALRARSHEEVTGSEPDAGDEVAPAPAPAAEEELAARQLESHCAAFCAALDSPARALFEARFRAGLSVEETARRLQVSEHQVKRGERHLKKRFFLEMKRHGYFEGYRLGRGGLERAALLLILCAGAQV